MQSVLVMWTTENQLRATTLSSTDVKHWALDTPALSWGVMKQATVALSSLEAEYQGMGAVVREALYWRQLLEDLGIQPKHPVAVGEDN